MKLLLFSVHNFSQIPGHFVKKHIFNAVFTYRSWPKLVHWRSYCANARFLWHFYKMKASKTVIRELLFTLCTAVVRKWKMYVFVKVLYVEQRKCHFFPEMQMNDYTILCQIRFFWPLLLLSIESSIFWGQTCLANKQNSEKKNVENRTFQLLSISKPYFFQYFLGGVRVSLTAAVFLKQKKTVWEQEQRTTGEKFNIHKKVASYVEVYDDEGCMLKHNPLPCCYNGVGFYCMHLCTTRQGGGTAVFYMTRLWCTVVRDCPCSSKCWIKNWELKLFHVVWF